jgi:PAS domain S-box-containing protein
VIFSSKNATRGSGSLQHEVTRTLAESSTPGQALPPVLESLCRRSDWALALFWLLDRHDEALRVHEAWHEDDPAVAAFVALNEERSLPHNEALPGQTWAAAEPIWVSQRGPDRGLLTEREGAIASGFRGALGVPVPRDGRVMGVIELFGRTGKQPSPAKVRDMANVAAQLGQFMGRKEIEEAVLVSERLKSAVVESALDGIITMDHEGVVLEFNPAAERIFGYRRSHAVGKPLAELIIPPLLRKAHRSELERFVSEGASPILNRRLELPAMRAGGREIPVELTVTAVQTGTGPPVFVGFVRDLSAQKKTEIEMRRAQELHKLMLNNAQDLISLMDPMGRIVYASPSHRRILGYEPQEMEGMSLVDLVHPDDADLVAEGIAENATGGSRGFGSEIRLRHRDGHWVTIEGVSTMIVRDGELPLILNNARDVSERRQSEETLRHLAAIVETSQDAIFTKSMDGTVLTWNPGAERLYGYRAAEIVGRSVEVLVPTERRGELTDILSQLQSGKRIEHYETVRVRKDGTRVAISLSVSPIVDRQGRVTACSAIARDISGHHHIGDLDYPASA